MPPAAESAPPSVREPAWRGADVVVFLLVAAFVGVVTLLAALLIASVGARMQLRVLSDQPLLTILGLIAQACALGAGFAVAAAWIPQQSGVGFLAAIHWRRMAQSNVTTFLLLGAVVSIILQVLLVPHLPNPGPLPEDRMFTPATIWPLTIYGVVVAPFFEEFYFRGLIYPSLKATFADGFTAEDRRSWHTVTRILAALALVSFGFVWLRDRQLMQTAGARAGAAGALVAAIVLAFPQIPLAIAGWIFNALARLKRPELLAILVTGLLFGLVHSLQLAGAWVPVLLLIAVGIILTAIRARTGTLMASWLFHMAYNGTLFALMFGATNGFHDFRHLH